MDRAHDVHDQVRARVGADRSCDCDRSGLGRRSRAKQVSRTEHENDGQKERAGDESPARRGEGVQHVVNCDNKGVTRG
jgi:hypothetical protein